MESVLSSSDKQRLVSSFLEIAVGNTAETARQFLQATGWRLEEAIQLFYVGSEATGMASSCHPSLSSSTLKNNSLNDCIWTADDQVRPPLPVVRETLYDGSAQYMSSSIGYQQSEGNSVIAFRNFGEEMKDTAVWAPDQNGTSITDESHDNLASLYRPPFALMHQGSFDKAKIAAAAADKWLLVNLQSAKEFNSHLLNRDTWANEAVAQTIKSNFIFWQVYEDTSEGKKVSTYYKLETFPVTLIIDPITGQKMRSWCGMVHPDRLLEDLLQYMDNGPRSHSASPHKRPRENFHAASQKIREDSLSKDVIDEDEEVQLALAVSLEDMQKVVDKGASAAAAPTPSYLSLPEEPEGDRKHICRVAVRFPDGRRIQRCFLRNAPVQLLWSFCNSELGEAHGRPFRLAHVIPGARKFLDYDNSLTFEQAGVANSMISLTWE